MDNKRTPIEKIKAYHSAKGYLSENNQILLQKMMGIAEQDLKRVTGLDIETEFILVLYMLNACNEIIGFEEGIARLTNVACPDLYVELKNGKRLFIEIKENNINLTKTGLEKMKNFAEKFQAEFYVAVKQNNLWALYDYEYLKKRNPKKIIWNEDYKNSLFNELFGNITYFLPNDLLFECIYDKNLNLKTASHYKNYGCLEKLIIKYQDIVIFETKNSEEAESICFSLESIITEASKLFHEEKYIDGSHKTIVSDKLYLKNHDGIYINLFNLLLEPVIHTLKPNKENYDFTSFLQNQYANKDNIAKHKTNIILYLNLLKEAGYPIIDVKLVIK